MDNDTAILLLIADRQRDIEALRTEVRRLQDENAAAVREREARVKEYEATIAATVRPCGHCAEQSDEPGQGSGSEPTSRVESDSCSSSSAPSGPASDTSENELAQ